MRVLTGKATAVDLLRATFDQLVHEVVLLDATGRIVVVNEPFLRFGRQNGFPDPESCIGMNYLSHCRDAARTGDRTAGRIAQALVAVLLGQRDTYTTVYACHSPWQQRWFRLTMTHWSRDGERGAILVHENTTAEVQVERAIAHALLNTPTPGETQYSIRLQDRLDAMALRLEALTGQAFSAEGATDLAAMTSPEPFLTGLARLLLRSRYVPGTRVLLDPSAAGDQVVLSIHGLADVDEQALQSLIEVPGRCDVATGGTAHDVQVQIFLQRARRFEA